MSAGWIYPLVCILTLENLNSSTCQKVDDKVYFQITADSNPYLLAKNNCKNEYPNCMNLAVPTIELILFEKYGKPLSSHGNHDQKWKYNQLCHCMFPPTPFQKPGLFQYFHIPKTGTSINFFLHDFFENCSTSTKIPCPKWLTEPGEYQKGLCNSKLFSCGGHIVSEDFVSVTLNSPTNLISLLRDPFERLRSTYFHIINNPSTEILKPHINITQLLYEIKSAHSSSSSSHSTSFIKFIKYPGISNCMTKMLNGIACGYPGLQSAHETNSENSFLNETNVYLAKEILQSMLYFGLTDYFKTSVCSLSWMYGGEVKPFHFQKFREGRYNKSDFSIDVLLPTSLDKELFYRIERYDIEVYEYAKKVFMDRLRLTGCPIID